MATLRENLITRRNAIGVELAALDATKVGGLADAVGSPLHISHVAYKDALYRELAQIEERLAATAPAVEVRTYGIV